MVCVVIPTDDKKTVKLGHFGDAKYYLHYVKGEDGWTLVSEVVNPYKEDEEHEHEHNTLEKRQKILELNKDCDIFVYTVFGPGGEDFMKKHGKVVVRVKPRTTIEEALRAVEESLH
ncbi:NifB/NifX family molybdenum-iron cluster-binding protein [Ignicoccus hospitalis]|uniref:Dinitrogenase iron-molybdenum cofactor biosynthesis domain-containing protein n=1 Tax=Ignicoccus hospitalis (strain KIN4/I / DSM 18386 / JCM 14125) TaxID=453591 RepID=A8A8V1_IGNH4|nr:NifB/NifX family molybdenum-iron cluster-binding protein [Ignicoccus hospitalis]ABU81353.1 hypothetical protein Igni_0169 [Ignicoccus hospitalis KIN4/I]HIH90343.1 hypothetical protein [Desulfurococcaceae archaeon]